jgi:NAD(P)H-hydrate epimerase
MPDTTFDQVGGSPGSNLFSPIRIFGQSSKNINSMRTLSRSQSRQVDLQATRQFGIAGLVLMENAGRGVVDVLCQLGAESPVAICCGKGNNAGDGFVIARHLLLRGLDARVLIWGDPALLEGDTRTNFQILHPAGIQVLERAERDEETTLRHLADATWIVDALLGTGSQGAPRSPLDKAIEQMNRQAAPILAVDLPSGLDCDTGDAPGPVIRARHTCTFVAPKPGLLKAGIQEITGQLHILDIGIPRSLVDAALAAGGD